MELIQEATDILGQAQVHRPQWSAEQLLAERLGCLPVDLYVEAPPIAKEESGQFFADVAARAGGVPLQYLLGSTDFYGREFAVGPGVFIPRPETEVLIDVVLEIMGSPAHRGRGVQARSSAPARPTSLREIPRSSPTDQHAGDTMPARDFECLHAPSPAGRLAPDTRSVYEACPTPARSAGFVLVDVGTGSGAIAITLAKEQPGLRVIAIDPSTVALHFARRNAQRHECQISLLQGDLLECLVPHSVDLVIANLPYLDPAEASTWPRELSWEPWLALDGGKGGVELIGRLLAQAPGVLRPGGRVVLEIGMDQGESVRTLAERHGFQVEQILPDLAGIERIAILRAMNPSAWKN